MFVPICSSKLTCRPRLVQLYARSSFQLPTVLGVGSRLGFTFFTASNVWVYFTVGTGVARSMFVSWPWVRSWKFATFCCLAYIFAPDAAGRPHYIKIGARRGAKYVKL